MTKFLFLISAFCIIGCGFDNANFIENQNGFAVRSAKMGLWNEAIMRWERIIDMDPRNAKAYNNLGVAYEAKGELEKALVYYKNAVELDPNNRIYMSNYIKFKRNYDKFQKRNE